MERLHGRAGALLGRPWPESTVPTVTVVEVGRPALVMGSTQPESAVDRDRAAAAGVDVARRRSGGGVVLVEPGGLVWVDVLVPAGDPLWDPDVGRAFGWLGRAWAAALADAGVPGARVHEGAPAAGPWSALVCFAGLGPGEVTVGGAKVVGISARRTRAGALFQSAALLAWDAESLVGLLAEHPADPALLADLAAGAAVDAVSLTGALLARLAGC